MLKRALNEVNNIDLFRIRLRILWSRRAQRYFDGRSAWFPYIVHDYDLNTGSVITFSNIDKFSLRTAQPFWDVRNPLEPEESIYRILNVHAADRGTHNEFDIFMMYRRHGLRRARYYFELHLSFIVYCSSSWS